jgi:hypothetical protein
MGKFGIIELLVIMIMLLLFLLPFILYLVTLQNTLKEIKPENRKMQPGEVWLMFIPLFSLVWHFIMINRISDSLKLEFNSRGIQTNENRPGFGIGLAQCILFCCGIIPVLGILSSIAGLICWIIYWSKIHGFKTKLQYSNSHL